LIFELAVGKRQIGDELSQQFVFPLKPFKTLGL